MPKDDNASKDGHCGPKTFRQIVIHDIESQNYPVAIKFAMKYK